jgi:ectoine hydroxylase-related dioxygenase (phytanoyl-CoA dioxygenase family)
LERNGFAVILAVVSDACVAELIDATAGLSAAAAAVREKGGRIYAVRRLCELSPAAAALAQSQAIRALVEPVLGPSAQHVRSLLFDKNASANWKVPWHQDLSIAVKERRDVPGFGPWSTKAGVVHVQPPIEVLENMLTVRLHLDDCGLDNGPLRLIAESHKLGVIDMGAIARLWARMSTTACTVERGGVLLMRPLLLHASSPAVNPRNRRVIHLEFAADDLPGGLKWHES